MTIGRLAIIVGHNTKAPGAWGNAPINMGEYYYNFDVAGEIKNLCDVRQIDSQIFLRNSGLPECYAEVNAYCTEVKPSCAIELHFNAGPESARGTEVLYDAEPAESLRLSSLLHASICLGFKRCGKEVRGVKLLKEGDRGHYQLSLARVPACIVEPFFGSNTDDCALGVNSKLEYVKAIVTAVTSFLKTQI